MTIYFSPYYDSSLFLTEDDCGVGKVYLGSDGLLREMELRSGMYLKTEEEIDRVISYIEAIQKTLSTDGPLFFAESFSRDDFGTAELLLSWRDALVKLGWNGTSIEESEKIDGLARIEKWFNCPGTADRWKRILDFASTETIFKNGEKIVVQCPKEYLEPVLRKLLDDIDRSSGNVEYRPFSESTTVPKILSFKDEYEAHEWIASQSLGTRDVVAEADGALVAEMLGVFGKPSTGAIDNSIGSIMRLLPIGISLFKHPVDISVLQSYLQSVKSPLDKLYIKVKEDIYVSLKQKLLEHICTFGGFGEKWDNLISEAIYKSDGTIMEEKQRSRILSFIGMWNRGCDNSEVQKYVEGLSKWCNGYIAMNSEFSTQFVALKKNCHAMMRLINSAEAIPIEKLCRWAVKICRPIEISNDYARRGSMNLVSSLAKIYSQADRLIWYAAVTGNDTTYRYDFLSRKEIRRLNENGIPVPDKELMTLIDKAYRKEGLARCRKIEIVTCERISGVETVEDSILSEYIHNYSVDKGIAVPKEEYRDVDQDMGKYAKHAIEPGILKEFTRKNESYSSINTLIQSPVDYILDYVKHYHQYGMEQVADIATSEGTVAHAYIEKLGETCGYDMKKIAETHRNSFDSILDKVMETNGAILLTEKNRLGEKNFRISLKESIDVLINIFINNNLEIVEKFEYEATTIIPRIGSVYAKIDCLLRAPDGEYVIIDFKWSSSSTYKSKLEEHRELQLAVYKRVVEDTLGKVKFVGYYAIPRKKLYTRDTTLTSPNIFVVDYNDYDEDIFEMAVKGYEFRRNQINRGILEEGEGMELADLEYADHPELYPLDTDYNNSSLKATAYGGKNSILKGGVD